jgi:hypothetical protein
LFSYTSKQNRLTICVFYNISGVSKSPLLFFNNIPAWVVNNSFFRPRENLSASPGHPDFRLASYFHDFGKQGMGGFLSIAAVGA